MKRYVDIERIGKQFGTCLWVASYKTTGLQLAPDFAYFPSMNYVAMWQFADNWHGTDGNVELVSVIKGDVKNAVAVKPTVTVSYSAWRFVVVNRKSFWHGHVSVGTAQLRVDQQRYSSVSKN